MRGALVPSVMVLLVAGCVEPGVSVTVKGSGLVRSSSFLCRDTCQFPGASPQALTAVANEGWTFQGWSGACAGVDSCVVAPGGAVQATFEPASVIEVHVAGDGEGRVLSSDSRECTSDCAWSTAAPVTLTAHANVGSRFAGFTGACVGMEPCALSAGQVTATFERARVIQISILGDGSGSVTVGETSCTQSCAVEVGSAPVTLSAISGLSTLPPILTGACATTPCSVSAPATVTVEFRRGRQVTVTRSGTGTGSVTLNGAELCGASLCATVVPTDLPLEFSAAPLDDYNLFIGLDGSGCVSSPCVVAPGADAVALRARFDSVLAWYRTLDAAGQALEADSVGLTLAVVASGSVTVDGTTYSVVPGAAPSMGVVLQFNWDAGTDWVLPLNAHQNQDANPMPEFADILRLSDGGVVVSGSCTQGRLNGAAPCGAYSTPLTLFVGANGVLENIHTDSNYGSSTSAQGTLFDLHEVGGRLIGFRGIGLFGGNTSGGLGYVERDGGFSPLFSRPGMPTSFVPLLNHCTDASGGLRCLFFHDDAFTLDACTVAAGTGSLDPTLVEFDAELRCQRGFRIRAGSLSIASPSSPSVSHPENLLYGISPPTDFGGGLGTISLGTWIAEWQSTSITRFGQNLQFSNMGMGTFPLGIDRVDGGVVAQTQVALQPGSSVDLFGTRHVDSAISFDLISASDLATPLRHWSFTDSSVIPMQLLSSTPLQIVDGKIVVLVTGVNVKFGRTALATDNRRHTHLVVLQP